ncbi:MAG TPA: Zn-dependent hydrolase [Acidimicrobiaceae bacterium]|nr:Zn-dependent hydrolase [Acidimicrobiaceae bacterium]
MESDAASSQQITAAVSWDRLAQRLAELAVLGNTGDGGCARLACTDQDKAGRDLVVTWMRDLDLEISVDGIGNVIGTQRGFVPTAAPVMCGSHIDTVATGGTLDGNFGVLAGLEVIETIQRGSISLPRPLAVGFFTNEEGARFAPDMLGSLTFVGGLALEEALDTIAIDGARLGDELSRIGYHGMSPLPAAPPHAFVELHIEQGPVLEAEGYQIGVVTGVQGISWQAVRFVGQSNHAGTTPMHLRKDPAYAAFATATKVRELALQIGGTQVGTVGKIDLVPNLINVVAREASFTVDLRNTEESTLRQAEAAIAAFIDQLADSEGLEVSRTQLARFEPVNFDERVVGMIERIAARRGVAHRRLPSGAGHDAQMLSRVCPTAMIFVPSVNGISHNPAEFTAAEDLAEGAQILLETMVELASTEF